MNVKAKRQAEEAKLVFAVGAVLMTAILIFSLLALPNTVPALLTKGAALAATLAIAISWLVMRREVAGQDRLEQTGE